MSGIIWLASYPKSGNTWLRILVSNLLAGGDGPIDINSLETAGMASSRESFDLHTGLEASDLTHEEIDRLRPGVYRRTAELASEHVHLKVHDAYVHTSDGDPLFPADATSGAVYVLRNPLDVVPSQAHHWGAGVDGTIAELGNPRAAMAAGPNRLHEQLRQRLGTWSQHVASWVDDAPFPVEVVRYEDLHEEPVATVARVARFMGLPADEEAVATAIRFSAFDEVRRQEARHGFSERSRASTHFFRTGAVGSWRASLTADQAARVVADHRDVMERFGYLRDGEPVY